MDLLLHVVFNAYGGYGREAHQFIKKLVESIAEKRDFETSAVMNYIFCSNEIFSELCSWY